MNKISRQLLKIAKKLEAIYSDDVWTERFDGGLEPINEKQQKNYNIWQKNWKDKKWKDIDDKTWNKKWKQIFNIKELEQQILSEFGKYSKKIKLTFNGIGSLDNISSNNFAIFLELNNIISHAYVWAYSEDIKIDYNYQTVTVNVKLSLEPQHSGTGNQFFSVGTFVFENGYWINKGRF